MTKNIRIKAITLLTLVVFLLGFTMTGYAAATPSKKLVVYAALNAGDMQWIQTQFKKDTGITLSFLTFSAGDAQAKVEAEKKNPQADVMVGGSVEFYEKLATENVFVKYTSSNAKGLDKQFLDPKGYWQGWYMGVLGLVYNTERFNKELKPLGVKEPKTWDDLLNPKYKGLFLTSNPATAGGGYIFVADQLFRLGETKGWNFLSKLNTNVHHYTKAAGDCIPLVGTGEFVIGMAWAHDIVKAAKTGYPIKVVVPENTAFEIGGAAVIKGGKNTENAKKFVDWLLTKNIQQMNTNYSNRYSVRKDVNAPTGMIKLQDVKLVNYDRAKATQMKDNVKKEFAQLFGV